MARLDTTFNPGFGANAMIWSVFLQPNGQMVVGGEFSTFNTNLVSGVARLNADGSVDTTFNPGTGPNGTVNAVAVDGFGRVIIGGDFDTVGGVSSGGIARLSVNGAIDPTFNPGIGTYNPDTGDTDPIHTIVLQATGKILIGGAFSYLEPEHGERHRPPEHGRHGGHDVSSGTGHVQSVTRSAAHGFVITLQPDGTILMGGNFPELQPDATCRLARLFADGNLDTSFMDTAYNQFAGVINHYHNNDASEPDGLSAGEPAELHLLRSVWNRA